MNSPQRVEQIEVEVELENIYARLSEHCKLSSRSVLVYSGPNVVSIYPPLAGDARDLELG